eukprot:EG_transcript_49895
MAPPCCRSPRPRSARCSGGHLPVRQEIRRLPSTRWLIFARHLDLNSLQSSLTLTCSHLFSLPAEPSQPTIWWTDADVELLPAADVADLERQLRRERRTSQALEAEV